jgi:probable rRNA maturation factor
LSKTYATDVLAFDFQLKQLPLKARQVFVARPLDIHGEVIISVDMALKQSKQFKTSASEELLLYILHGILHLRGYDDHKPKDISRMRAKEQVILKQLKPKRFFPLLLA